MMRVRRQRIVLACLIASLSVLASASDFNFIESDAARLLFFSVKSSGEKYFPSKVSSIQEKMGRALPSPLRRNGTPSGCGAVATSHLHADLSAGPLP